MLENEVFAIETFGSTGNGFVRYAKERLVNCYRKYIRREPPELEQFSKFELIYFMDSRGNFNF